MKVNQKIMMRITKIQKIKNKTRSFPRKKENSKNFKELLS